ncbi:hypothetical protein H0H81_003212 [Sphagnurus paluster]|uniref:Uncharacterized protein n=1 Tax=Sphagnurus paluster TaxID=117069 RepID=A0A9P7KL68_9AGAR|nr:hypothetical protein H0H81_003212 [Sphagnurus paluster]
MTVTVPSYLADIAHVPVSSYPGVLWKYYILYLWDYQPNSWVARIAYTCRILAILVSLPIIVLALLDISSYGIARTLGVIDDVKASTSDLATLHRLHNNTAAAAAPTIRIEGTTPSSPSSDFSSTPTMAMDDKHKHPEPPSAGEYPVGYLETAQPQAFYASEGDSLKLSGVGVFSPAASRPPSPVMTRRSLMPEGEEGNGNGNGLRQRVRQEEAIAE